MKLKRMLVAFATAALLTAGLAGSVGAHGAGGGQNHVDPEDKNCMGQVVSKNAQGHGGGMKRASEANHGGLDGPHDSVKELMDAIRAHCNSDE